MVYVVEILPCWRREDSFILQVNTIAADALATLGARAFAAMVLTQ